MSSKGSVLRCDVNGTVLMKAFLSGMPDVKLGLNDKLEARLRVCVCVCANVCACVCVCVHVCAGMPDVKLGLNDTHKARDLCV